MRDSDKIDRKIAKKLLHELMRINICIDDELYQEIINWASVRELLDATSKTLNRLIILANGG
jgi:hypothetical protein